MDPAEAGRLDPGVAPQDNPLPDPLPVRPVRDPDQDLPDGPLDWETYLQAIARLDTLLHLNTGP
jgi:hypothetical protein